MNNTNVVTEINIILQLSKDDLLNGYIPEHLAILNTMKHINKLMIINNLDNQYPDLKNIFKNAQNTQHVSPVLTDEFNTDTSFDIDTSIFKDINQHNVIICNADKKSKLIQQIEKKKINESNQNLDNIVIITYNNLENLNLILYALQTNFRTRSNSKVDYDNELSKLLYKKEKLFGFYLKPVEKNDNNYKNVSDGLGLTNDEQTIMLNIIANTRKDKSMEILNMTDINLNLKGGGLLGNIKRKIRRMRGKKTVKSNEVEKAKRISLKNKHGNTITYHDDEVDKILNKYGKTSYRDRLTEINKTKSAKKLKESAKINKIKEFKLKEAKKIQNYMLQARNKYELSLLLLKSTIETNKYANYKLTDFDIVMFYNNIQGLKIIDFILYTDVDEPHEDTIMKFYKQNIVINPVINLKKKIYNKRSAGLTNSEKKKYKTQKKKRIQDILIKEQEDKGNVEALKLEAHETMKGKSENRKKMTEKKKMKQMQKTKEKDENVAFKAWTRRQKAHAKGQLTKSQKKQNKTTKNAIIKKNKEENNKKKKNRGFFKRFFGIGKNNTQKKPNTRKTINEYVSSFNEKKNPPKPGATTVTF